MPTKPRGHPGQRRQIHFKLPDKEFQFVKLASGAVFPSQMPVTIELPDGPVLDLWLEVDDGRPVVASLRITRREAGAPITPSAVKQLPLREIQDDVVAEIAKELASQSMFGMILSMVPTFRGPRVFPPELPIVGPEESQYVIAGAVRSQRGRPVGDESLRQVAEIVAHNGFNPRKAVAKALFVSDRTASRWIADAKKKGFIGENDNA